MRRPESSLADLPVPPQAALELSARLEQSIREAIAAAGGALGFERYMALALYAPGLGYYSAGSTKFGAAGDFVTAPELSPLFSRCLARQCAQVLAALGGGDILEFGAGSGVMAADILAELAALDALPARYLILEASAELRARQQQTLAARVPALLGRVHWLDALPERLRGVVLGNEVLDAMPVRRFCIEADGPRELVVRVDEAGRLALGTVAADAGLSAAIAGIEAQVGALPPDYSSEFNPYLDGWIAALGETLEAGAVLLIDYGYSRAEYYHPQRNRGTLLCHYRHRAHEDALRWPGLQDITANVDFTAVADAALAAGFDIEGYCGQAYFLFGCGLEQMLAEIDPTEILAHTERVRQIKLLTLPGEMGERFRVIGLGRNLDVRLCGFAMFDERGRL